VFNSLSNRGEVGQYVNIPPENRGILPGGVTTPLMKITSKVRNNIAGGYNYTIQLEQYLTWPVSDGDHLADFTIELVNRKDGQPGAPINRDVTVANGERANVVRNVITTSNTGTAAIGDLVAWGSLPTTGKKNILAPTTPISWKISDITSVSTIYDPNAKMIFLECIEYPDYYTLNGATPYVNSQPATFKVMANAPAPESMTFGSSNNEYIFTFSADNALPHSAFPGLDEIARG